VLRFRGAFVSLHGGVENDAGQSTLDLSHEGQSFTQGFSQERFQLDTCLVALEETYLKRISQFIEQCLPILHKIQGGNDFVASTERFDNMASANQSYCGDQNNPKSSLDHGKKWFCYGNKIRDKR